MLGPIVPWIVAASAVMFLLNQGITFWKDHLREQPSPPDTYATKHALEEGLRQAHGRMNRERDDAKAALGAAETRMREELGRLTAEVTGYNTKAEDRASRINGRIDDLSDKVTAAPGQVVEILARTKGLLG